MSFSSETKNELAMVMPEKKCCVLAEISGFIRMCGTIRIAGKGKINVRLLTENPAAARKMMRLLKTYFGIKAELVISKTVMLKKNHYYELLISEEMQAEQILRETGILSVEGGFNYIDYRVPEAVVKKKCCKRAYLRGVFLGSGSVSDPEKMYHLEIVSNNEALSQEVKALINHFGLNAKITPRKKNFVVYMKESEQVVDFLNIMGAHNSLLAFENVRIMKQIRNKTNRIVNCETANLTKTVDASVRQVECIQKIQRNKGLTFLPPKLREIAELRLENPEASLAELGTLLSPPVGKSGVNHRLKKIEEIAMKLGD